MAGLVICLCAQWCDICEGYRAAFDAVAREHGSALCFRWLDIEDEEDLLDGVEVSDFPTLLLVDEHGVRHFGVVRADEGSLRRLLARWAAGELPVIASLEPLALARRVAVESGRGPTDRR
jgi:thioredoxin 1